MDSESIAVRRDHRSGLFLYRRLVPHQAGCDNAGEKQFFIPDEGPVKISCTDDKGRNRDIKITVKYVNL